MERQPSPSGWILAIVIAFSPSPLYAAYATKRAGRASPRHARSAARLRVSSGCPGSIALTIAICINFYLWLDPPEWPTHAPGRPALKEVRLVYVATSFLSAQILTWAIPLAVLLVVGIYWAVVIRRNPDEL